MGQRYPMVDTRRITKEQEVWVKPALAEFRARYKGRNRVCEEETGLPRHLCALWLTQGCTPSKINLRKFACACVRAGIEGIPNDDMW